MKDRVDWAALLATEAKTRPLIRANDLANRYKFPYSSVIVALARQEKRGLVERIYRNLFLNKLATDLDVREIVNLIRPDSYISLDSALLEWGISTQSTVGVTCVSTSYASSIRTHSVRIDFRQIKKDLFWGFTERKGRYHKYKIAEPEKAILDWVYFRLNDGVPVLLDEFQFERIDASRLFQYAKRFPHSVLQCLTPALFEKRFAGQVLPPAVPV